MYTLIDVKTNARQGIINVENHSQTPAKAAMVFSQRLFSGSTRKNIRSVLSVIGSNGETYSVTVVRKRLQNCIKGFRYIHYIEK